MVEEAAACPPNTSLYFERAVRRERDGIRAHESAAEHQESAAAVLEARATKVTDLDRIHMLELAAEARSRAATARQRAQLARERLRAEGVDPASAG